MKEYKFGPNVRYCVLRYCEYSSKYVSEYNSEYISECTSECSSDYVRE